MDEGTRVFDSEDDDPDEAIVVHRPEDKTIADWEYEANGNTYTTAETNPDYPEDEQVVLISFLDQLAESWPDWNDVPASDLFEGVRKHEAPLYGFPEGRLVEADAHRDDDVDLPEEFETVQKRLEENDFDVTLDPEAAQLHVEKYGTKYVVSADGTVEGDDGLRNRVVSLVGRYL